MTRFEVHPEVTQASTIAKAYVLLVAADRPAGGIRCP